MLPVVMTTKAVILICLTDGRGPADREPQRDADRLLPTAEPLDHQSAIRLQIALEFM